MEQEIINGDLTEKVGVIPKLNTENVSGDTVKGISVAGQELKLSEILNGESPVFSKLSSSGEPSMHEFDNFRVCEMPGSTKSKATFALSSRDARMKQALIFKSKELFGVDIEDMPDMGVEFPYVIQVTDESVLSYALEIFKTLDIHLGEIRSAL